MDGTFLHQRSGPKHGVFDFARHAAMRMSAVHGNSKHFQIYSQLGLGYKEMFLAEYDESGDLY